MLLKIFKIFILHKVTFAIKKNAFSWHNNPLFGSSARNFVFCRVSFFYFFDRKRYAQGTTKFYFISFLQLHFQWKNICMQLNSGWLSILKVSQIIFEKYIYCGYPLLHVPPLVYKKSISTISSYIGYWIFQN